MNSAHIQISGDAIVVVLPPDLDSAGSLVDDILAVIYRRSAHWLVADLSAVAVVDRVLLDHLLRLLRSAHCLGATPILASVQPGVAAILVDLDADLDWLRTQRSAISALRWIHDQEQRLERSAAQTDHPDSRDGHDDHGPGRHTAPRVVGS